MARIGFASGPGAERISAIAATASPQHVHQLRGRPHQRRPVPAVAEPDVDHIGAGLQIFADVVGLEREPLVVAGPAGRQQILADPPPIDMTAVEAERADPELLTPPDLGEIELLPEVGRTFADAAIGRRPDHVGDPSRSPVGLRAARSRPHDPEPSSRPTRVTSLSGGASGSAAHLFTLRSAMCRPFYEVLQSLVASQGEGGRPSFAAWELKVRRTGLQRPAWPTDRATSSPSAPSPPMPECRSRRSPRCCAMPTASARSCARRCRRRWRSSATVRGRRRGRCAGGATPSGCSSRTSAIHSSPISWKG